MPFQSNNMSSKNKSTLFRFFAKTSTPSFLSEGTKMAGTLLSYGRITIGGFFQGEIRARGVRVLEQGMIEGNVTAKKVVVSGEIKGRIYAHEVILSPGSFVEGDIFYDKMKLSGTARVEGKMQELDESFLFPSDTFIHQNKNIEPEEADKMSQNSRSLLDTYKKKKEEMKERKEKENRKKNPISPTVEKHLDEKGKDKIREQASLQSSKKPTPPPVKEASEEEGQKGVKADHMLKSFKEDFDNLKKREIEEGED